MTIPVPMSKLSFNDYSSASSDRSRDPGTLEKLGYAAHAITRMPIGGGPRSGLALDKAGIESALSGIEEKQPYGRERYANEEIRRKLSDDANPETRSISYFLVQLANVMPFLKNNLKWAREITSPKMLEKLDIETDQKELINRLHQSFAA